VDDAVSGLRKSGNLFLMTWFKKNFKFEIKKINREKIPLIVPRGDICLRSGAFLK